MYFFAGIIPLRLLFMLSILLLFIHYYNRVAILGRVNKKNIKKINSGTKPKDGKNSLNGNNISGCMKISFSISRNEEKKTFLLQKIVLLS